MSKIQATTYVILPIGSPIEQHTNTLRRVGDTFKIHHIDTKKVVNEARVTGVERIKRNFYLVRAVITK